MPAGLVRRILGAFVDLLSCWLFRLAFHLRWWRNWLGGSQHPLGVRTWLEVGFGLHLQLRLLGQVGQRNRSRFGRHWRGWGDGDQRLLHERQELLVWGDRLKTVARQAPY